MEIEAKLVAEFLRNFPFPAVARERDAVAANTTTAPQRSIRGLSILNRPYEPKPSRKKMEAQKLATEDEPKVLEFLGREPLKNLQMLGFIRDHGIVSRRNRGTFYGCSQDGVLVGVGLVGHWVILSGSPESMAVFGRVARLLHKQEVRLVLGEEEDAKTFDQIFAGDNGDADAQRAEETHLLFAIHKTDEEAQELKGLRLAMADDADLLVPIHAQAVWEHSGVDPLTQDAAGFRMRVLARVGMRRTWIVRDGDEILFKVDIASETDDAVYLEAVWTRPDMRGRGLGRAAVKGVCRSLLKHYRVVCLFADASEQRLVSFYRGIGFHMLAPYRLIRYSS